MADTNVPEHQHRAADMPFMHFGAVPVSVEGPVYVPAEGAAPALSRFEISYYPHLMRRVATRAGWPWVHSSHARFYVMTNLDVDRMDQATRTARHRDRVSYPDGPEGHPLHTFSLDVPVAITQCDLVIAEDANDGRMITMTPQVIPLNVPATAPEGDGDGS